jgi:hypothetical protein
MDTSEITAAFQLARGKWTGCHWPTRFGSRGLDLQGLKSSQAALMTRSTAGREAADWKTAMRWLEEVERDAQEAEVQAGTAAHLASIGQFEQALEHAQMACTLESNYNFGALAWEPLREAIETALHHSRAAGSASPRADSSTAVSPARRNQA